MGEMEEKIGAVLNNPQLMQQIMSMAQAMNTQPGPRQEATPEPQKSVPEPLKASPLPELDLGMLSKLSSAASQAGVDRNQQALLKALHPYLSRDRISRLERAMRAAKMAKLATSLLGQGGPLSQSGR